ncbi:hypothetical protein QKW60_12780 [Defluviimonas aestuarii]|uniref:hypothetical protein n=1 Tax=Albidovulum aestuarii TaxID=1130726 RepID=UPI00249CA381|nr:hypothetical protein [Defluviimonas aestuarii]MDI3337286.1 hypothetical protein [Defluviimonas aestuarii]
MSRAKSDPMQPACAEVLSSFENDSGRILRVVAVDLPPRVADVIRDRANASVETIKFGELDLVFLARATPDIVIGPLFERQWDVLDLAARLIRLGFGGRLYAVTPPLPDAGEVIAEIRRQNLEITIDLIVLDETD